MPPLPAGVSIATSPENSIDVYDVNSSACCPSSHVFSTISSYLELSSTPNYSHSNSLFDNTFDILLSRRDTGRHPSALALLFNEKSKMLWSSQLGCLPIAKFPSKLKEYCRFRKVPYVETWCVTRSTQCRIKCTIVGEDGGYRQSYTETCRACQPF
jgi:hypothetical protein